MPAFCSLVLLSLNPFWGISSQSIISFNESVQVNIYVSSLSIRPLLTHSIKNFSLSVIILITLIPSIQCYNLFYDFQLLITARVLILRLSKSNTYLYRTLSITHCFIQKFPCSNVTLTLILLFRLLGWRTTFITNSWLNFCLMRNFLNLFMKFIMTIIKLIN